MVENKNNMVCEDTAAQILGISVYTLRNRRAARKAPKFLKIGSLIRYRLKDLQEFLDSCLVELDEKIEEKSC